MDDFRTFMYKLEKLGINVYRQNGKYKSMYDLIGELNTVYYDYNKYLKKE